jgi:hypothetical protein
VTPGDYEILVLGDLYRLDLLAALRHERVERQFGRQDSCRFGRIDVAESIVAGHNLLTTVQQSWPHKKGAQYYLSMFAASRHQDRCAINLC